MFEKIKSSPNVVALRFTGKLDTVDASSSKRALDDALQNQGQLGQLGLVVDISGLSDISAEGMESGIKADMDFYSHIDRFSRVAFVSDKEWPRAMVGMLAGLMALPQMKVFGASKLDAALQWAALPADATGIAETKPTINVIRTDNPDVMGFEIDGRISDEAASGLIAQMKDFLAREGKLRMLVRIKHLGGFDPAVIMHSGFVSMKFAAIGKLERYAIVGAPGWMAKAVSAMNPLLGSLDMRNFARGEEVQAWDWLGAKPVN